MSLPATAAEEISGLLKAAAYTAAGFALSLAFSVFRQLFLLRSKTEPPAVFHWIPYVGSAVAYGMDPVAFFEKYRAKVSAVPKSCLIPNTNNRDNPSLSYSRFQERAGCRNFY